MSNELTRVIDDEENIADFRVSRNRDGSYTATGFNTHGRELFAVTGSRDLVMREASHYSLIYSTTEMKEGE